MMRARRLTTASASPPEGPPAKPVRLSDVMTPDPVTLPVTASLSDAAQRMTSADVSAVIVLEAGTIRGVLTDGDIIVRTIVEGRHPARTKLGDICRRVAAVEQTATIAEADRLMRRQSAHQLPVTARGRPVGIVSAGRLAMASSVPACEDTAVSRLARYR
ncbi:MAG TPA: CBS domain-containing protein [Mycobacteriales bacterium]|nr:CBS domain-containing protein [Mycobacteriales bacterium]